MISELNKDDFYKCNRLVNEKGQLEVKAVIARVNPGRIFVDNIYFPNLRFKKETIWGVRK
ncbi:TPA: GNAT family acetyltransferase [Bacillus thuringiensis]|nr:GNAT family acetyltransferase [Bacillus thuringiensis]